MKLFFTEKRDAAREQFDYSLPAYVEAPEYDGKPPRQTMWQRFRKPLLLALLCVLATQRPDKTLDPIKPPITSRVSPKSIDGPPKSIDGPPESTLNRLIETHNATVCLSEALPVGCSQAQAKGRIYPQTRQGRGDYAMDEALSPVRR